MLNLDQDAITKVEALMVQIPTARADKKWCFDWIDWVPKGWTSLRQPGFC